MEEIQVYLYVSKGRHVFASFDPLDESPAKKDAYYVTMHPSIVGEKRRGRPPGKLLSNNVRRLSLSLGGDIAAYEDAPQELIDAGRKTLIMALEASLNALPTTTKTPVVELIDGPEPESDDEPGSENS